MDKNRRKQILIAENECIIEKYNITKVQYDFIKNIVENKNLNSRVRKNQI
jgi:hypothetical protein